MKKFMLLVTLLVAFAAIDAVTPNEAQALMPLACSTAADYNWENRGWNTLCEWALQMDPGWNEDNGSWQWTAIDPSDQKIEPQLQLTPDSEVQTIYAMSGEIKKVLWYPLRT